MADKKQQIDELFNLIKARLKQEVNGEQENLDAFVRDYVEIVSRIGWKAAQKWCKWENEGPVLMPDFTRIYYRKGETEIVLQEFPPQIRYLKFKASLDDPSLGTFSEEGLKVRGFSLALPYTIFIFKFSHGIFERVSMAFSDHPLKDTSEKPLQPYFPNISYEDLNVCLGEEFQFSGLEKGNIAQQCSYILSHFWNSTFSKEWDTGFYKTKKHFADIQDGRLTCFNEWQKASFEDSLFVVSDVEWVPSVVDSYGDLMVEMMQSDNIDSRFQQEVYDQYSKELLEELKKSVSNNINKGFEKVSVTNFQENVNNLLT